jgi:hypothetical protein
MNVLAIIDMQREFSETAEPLIPKVIKRIERAKKKNQCIVFVEYVSRTSIYSTLLNTVKDYKKVKRVCKYSDNGAREIAQALSNYRNIEIDICGVNLGACVQDTAYGLLKYKRFRKVNILVTACNDTESGFQFAIGIFKEYTNPKLKLINKRALYYGKNLSGWRERTR